MPTPLPPRFLDPLIDQLQKLVASAPEPDELRRKLQVVAGNALSQLDLVTREEFEAQRAVLLRTREKVDALERQLAEWEQRQLAEREQRQGEAPPHRDTGA